MTGGRLDPDELAYLEEQRDFLLTSLADLEREHAAGDLSDVDFEQLNDDYTARTAAVLRAIEDQRNAFAEAKVRPSWGRRLAVWGGVALFAVLAGWAASSALGIRKAGESASGGVSVKETTSQRAAACIQLISQTEPAAALECFEEVGKDDPNDPVLLTWSAWQLSLSSDLLPEELAPSVRARAAERLDQAVKINPNYSPALAFRAIVTYRNNEPAKALEYLEIWEATNPSQEMQQVVQQMDLRARIEAAIEAGTAPTTTAPSDTTAPGSSPEVGTPTTGP